MIQTLTQHPGTGTCLLVAAALYVLTITSFARIIKVMQGLGRSTGTKTRFYWLILAFSTAGFIPVDEFLYPHVVMPFFGFIVLLLFLVAYFSLSGFGGENPSDAKADAKTSLNVITAPFLLAAGLIITNELRGFAKGETVIGGSIVIGVLITLLALLIAVTLLRAEGLPFWQSLLNPKKAARKMKGVSP